MIAGHFATALVPYALIRKESPAPFWLFLLAAQFLDVLMLLFVSAGVEKLEPTNFLQSSFSTMRSEMFLSHDIIPVAGWAGIFGLVVYVLTKNRITSLWCAMLVILHEICDLVVGFEHYVLGADTTAVGLNLYNTAPVKGLLLEAALCGAIVFWFCNHRANSKMPVSPMTKYGLYGLLVGSTLATLPMANQSLASLFGISV